MTNTLLLDPRNVYTDEKRPFVIWGKGDGVIFQDLEPDQFDEALDFLRKSVPTNKLLRSMCTHKNEKAVQEYLDRMLFILSGGCSMIALDAETNETLGVLLMFPTIAANYTWPMISLKVSHTYIMEYWTRLIYESVTNATELEKYFNIDICMHYFEIVVSPKMAGKFFKEKLLLQAYKVSRSMGIQTITWVCGTKNDQERARRVGMTLVNCIHYRNFLDNNRCQVFNNVGRGENSACLFAMAVGDQCDQGYLNDEVEEYRAKHRVDLVGTNIDQ